MKIPIISLAVVAVCFGFPGCTNARSLPSKQPDNFLLVLSEQEFFNVQYPTYDKKKTKIGSEDFTNVSRSYYLYNDMTFNCANNSIYVLKSDSYHTTNADHNTLDVINFNKNKKLKTVNHVKDIFDGAISTTSDWTTGKIYWTVFRDGKFSMKVIDKSFEKLEYIIQPNAKTYMGKLLVYPRRNELFFLSVGKLWYTSNSLNSTASLLFESGKEFSYIYDFTIDYATDKLYIFEGFGPNYILKHIDIGISDRPLNLNDIDEIGLIPFFAHNLVAFNNKIYWTLLKDGVLKLYFKNGNKTAVKVTNLSGNSILSFVSSNCPSSTVEKKEQKNNEIKSILSR